MDAIDFVKEYGFEYSKAVLKQAPDNANYVEWYPLRSRFYITDFGCNRAVLLVYLKQIVEAFELVESFGGLFQAKVTLYKEGFTGGIECGDRLIEDAVLKQAIELVEKCNES